jgi:3',5'-nucleoside bisphosphate phosphatase
MLDLHTHSTCSDGSETPDRVVELASEAGCSAVALTDHDGCFGLAMARARAGEIGIRFVPGCEVSCRHNGTSLHLLCYFVDEDSPTINALLEKIRGDRALRNAAIAARLRELGYGLSLADVAAEAKGDVVGRPHFAAVLMRLGAANSIEDAFDRILGEGRPGYVARAPLSPGDVIDAASADGGVACLAHPFASEPSIGRLSGLVDDLQGAGLVGLEAWYASYDPPRRMLLAELARTKGLVATGGSDFHGAYRPGVTIGIGEGDLEVADGVLDELARRR